MYSPLDALRSSVARLRSIAGGLSDEQLLLPAYPEDWTIAQTLSHVGSGAVIMKRRLDDGLLEQKTADDFAPGVWEIWNAKSPREQVDGALVADRELLERAESVTDDERARVQISMGPMLLSFDDFMGLRLNEHALHTWDVEVALDPQPLCPSRSRS